MTTNYLNGSRYEGLIRRAHNCSPGQKHGAYREALTNLIAAEDGQKSYGLPSAQKQLDNLKKYISKALEKFQKEKLTENEAFQLHKLMMDTQNAYSSDELIEVVNSALILTDRFKPNS
jgi:hypothetical protein